MAADSIVAMTLFWGEHVVETKVVPTPRSFAVRGSERRHDVFVLPGSTVDAAALVSFEAGAPTLRAPRGARAIGPDGGAIDGPGATRLTGGRPLELLFEGDVRIRVELLERADSPRRAIGMRAPAIVALSIALHAALLVASSRQVPAPRDESGVADDTAATMAFVLRTAVERETAESKARAAAAGEPWYPPEAGSRPPKRWGSDEVWWSHVLWDPQDISPETCFAFGTAHDVDTFASRENPGAEAEYFPEKPCAVLLSPGGLVGIGERGSARDFAAFASVRGLVEWSRGEPLDVRALVRERLDVRGDDATVAEVHQAVSRAHARFRRCYEEGLRAKPKLEGRVFLRIGVIGADGLARGRTSGGPDVAVRECLWRAFAPTPFAPRAQAVTGEFVVQLELRPVENVAP